MPRSLCLLIVDDETELLEAISETCGHLGYNVIMAKSAEEALVLLKKHDVDVVLTDVRMRPMSGFGLLTEARKIYPQVPFVLWTGFWEKDDEDRAKSFARVETMSKPFSLKQVQEVLDRILLLKKQSPSGPLKGLLAEAP